MVQKVSVCSIATPEHALGTLRLAGPLEEIGVDVAWFQPSEPFSPEQLTNSDLIVIQRDFPRFTNLYSQIMGQARASLTPVIFELDDLLWELPEKHNDRATGFYVDALLPMLAAALNADAVTVASPGLQKYFRSLNLIPYLLPNYLNDKLWQIRPPSQNLSKHKIIGYIGGDSHASDLQMISPVLQSLLAEHLDRLQLSFFGVHPPESLSHYPNVRWTPLTPGNYARFAARMQAEAFDILIAPLQRSRFNECKSPIKYLEYTALGAPVVCSRITPFENVIDHGKTGYLANSLEDWKYYLDALILNDAARVQMASLAQKSLQENWLLSKNAHSWGAVYQAVEPRDPVPEHQAHLSGVLMEIHIAWQQRERNLKDNQEKQIAPHQGRRSSVYEQKNSVIMRCIRHLRVLKSRLVTRLIKKGERTGDY